MSSTTASSPGEHRETFACFGSECTVTVSDAVRPTEAAAAAATATQRLLEWHHRFSRFEHDSELARLNRDVRPRVLVSPLMRRLVEAAVRAAHETGGLVDATLVADIERAGYDRHFDGAGLPLAASLPLVPSRAPASRREAVSWLAIEVDRRDGTVTRPPGVELDLGGIAKGVFADELTWLLDTYDAFAIDCAGDIRLGGRSGTRREIHVASPFDDSTLHTFELLDAGVATSGIGNRSWSRADGRPAHHLLDPRTGDPAFTGIVQATAIAPTATEAEVLSKAAILSGPEHAASWLKYGGVFVLDDGSSRVLNPLRR